LKIETLATHSRLTTAAKTPSEAPRFRAGCLQLGQNLAPGKQHEPSTSHGCQFPAVFVVGNTLFAGEGPRLENKTSPFQVDELVDSQYVRVLDTSNQVLQTLIDDVSLIICR
jgi:hypothetical protein